MQRKAGPPKKGDQRVFMVRWQFPDHHPNAPMQDGSPLGVMFSFILGLGDSPLLDHLDEYGDPSFAQVRVVDAEKCFGCLIFDPLDNEPEGHFRFRESGLSLNEIWEAGLPVDF
jgi:hypothetical protein